MAGASMMGGAMAGSAMMDISSAYAQSQAMRMKGDFQKNADDINAKFADVAGADAIRRGDTNARLNMQRTREVIGAQRASFGAQGVDVNKGSAAEVQKSTAAVGALDSMTIRNNAIREALGYKVQSLNFSARGQVAQLEANNDSEQTLLTGGMSAIGSGAKAGYWFSQGGGGGGGGK